ncbi:MAG: hypothetical protein M0R51_12345 [Clostridia bacterium]|jgi:hypothetical protein|nr:hypothetical protein [Clostridia bacterium]
MARKLEFCIMPPGEFWTNERRPGLVRHEIFFGPFRQKSIRLGLVVFLTPEMHNMGNFSVHNFRGNDLILKRAGQQAAMDYYRWNTQQFINEFGKNYL